MWPRTNDGAIELELTNLGVDTSAIIKEKF